MNADAVFTDFSLSCASASISIWLVFLATGIEAHCGMLGSEGSVLVGNFSDTKKQHKLVIVFDDTSYNRPLNNKLLEKLTFHL